MISKEFIYEKVLPLVKNQSRMIDYVLIQSLFENKDDDILHELQKYQNKDGGFGKGLEPDVQMPHSSVLATTMAVKILRNIRNSDKKESMIKEIVHYFEKQYNEEYKKFFMVNEHVNDYPHAVWWNYSKDDEVVFGNPDAEIIGFLYKNRKYLQQLNYLKLMNQVVDFVMSKEFLASDMHVLLSVIEFYNYVDDDVKNLIHDRIHVLVKKELDASQGKWDQYVLQPYEIYILEPHFVNTHLEELGNNLNYIIEKIRTLSVTTTWQWYQYEEVFEKVKHQWVGHLYFKMIKALKLHRII